MRQGRNNCLFMTIAALDGSSSRHGNKIGSTASIASSTGIQNKMPQPQAATLTAFLQSIYPTDMGLNDVSNCLWSAKLYQMIKKTMSIPLSSTAVCLGCFEAMRFHYQRVCGLNAKSSEKGIQLNESRIFPELGSNIGLILQNDLTQAQRGLHGSLAWSTNDIIMEHLRDA